LDVGSEVAHDLIDLVVRGAIVAARDDHEAQRNTSSAKSVIARRRPEGPNGDGSQA
jgi:hypothetical protein